MKCWPSGRKNGSVRSLSPPFTSGFKTMVVSPPDAGTLIKPTPPRNENRITPLRLHDAPVATRESHSVIGVPPEASVFLSLPFAKKAINRLSGDQVGYIAPSVLGSGRASLESSGRTHSCTLPP